MSQTPLARALAAILNTRLQTEVVSVLDVLDGLATCQLKLTPDPEGECLREYRAWKFLSGS